MWGLGRRLWRPILGGAAPGLLLGMVVGNAISEPNTYNLSAIFPVAIAGLLTVGLIVAGILARSKELALTALAVVGAYVLGVWRPERRPPGS